MDKLKINQYKSAFDGITQYIENEQREQDANHFPEVTKMIGIGKIRNSDFLAKPIFTIAYVAKKAKKGGKP